MYVHDGSDVCACGGCAERPYPLPFPEEDAKAQALFWLASWQACIEGLIWERLSPAEETGWSKPELAICMAAMLAMLGV